MSVMWKGPSEALIAARNDPIAKQLHRRASKYNISYGVPCDGGKATVYSLRKIGDNYASVFLGEVAGSDPLNVFINVALEHTPHDAELFQLMTALLERRQDDLVESIRYFTRQAERAVDALAEIVQAATE